MAITELEWLTESDHPWDMLEYMLELTNRKASSRKWRLFLCAVCRRLWHLLPDEVSREAVASAEKYADGEIRKSELKRSWRQVYERCTDDIADFEWLAYGAAYPSAFDFDALLDWTNHAARASDGESACHCHLLRDIIGNPFRPIAISSGWLTLTVASLARSIYAERAFDRLPILADALEEAGCDAVDLLAHCRSAGPHVRGCWAVDLLLGKK